MSAFRADMFPSKTPLFGLKPWDFVGDKKWEARRYTCPVCLREFKLRDDCIRHINQKERTKEPLIIALPLEELRP